MDCDSLTAEQSAIQMENQTRDIKSGITTTVCGNNLMTSSQYELNNTGEMHVTQRTIEGTQYLSDDTNANVGQQQHITRAVRDGANNKNVRSIDETDRNETVVVHAGDERSSEEKKSSFTTSSTFSTSSRTNNEGVEIRQDINKQNVSNVERVKESGEICDMFLNIVKQNESSMPSPSLKNVPTDKNIQLLSRTIEYPDPQTIVIKEVKRLPDGSTVSSTKYETRSAKSADLITKTERRDSSTSKVVSEDHANQNRGVHTTKIYENTVNKSTPTQQQRVSNVTKTTNVVEKIINDHVKDFESNFDHTEHTQENIRRDNNQQNIMVDDSTIAHHQAIINQDVKKIGGSNVERIEQFQEKVRRVNDQQNIHTSGNNTTTNQTFINREKTTTDDQIDQRNIHRVHDQQNVDINNTTVHETIRNRDVSATDRRDIEKIERENIRRAYEQENVDFDCASVRSQDTYTIDKHNVNRTEQDNIHRAYDHQNIIADNTSTKETIKNRDVSTTNRHVIDNTEVESRRNVRDQQYTDIDNTTVNRTIRNQDVNTTRVDDTHYDVDNDQRNIRKNQYTDEENNYPKHDPEYVPKKNNTVKKDLSQTDKHLYKKIVTDNTATRISVVVDANHESFARSLRSRSPESVRSHRSTSSLRSTSSPEKLSRRSTSRSTVASQTSTVHDTKRPKDNDKTLTKVHTDRNIHITKKVYEIPDHTEKRKTSRPHGTPEKIPDNTEKRKLSRPHGPQEEIPETLAKNKPYRSRGPHDHNPDHTGIDKFPNSRGPNKNVVNSNVEKTTATKVTKTTTDDVKNVRKQLRRSETFEERCNQILGIKPEPLISRPKIDKDKKYLKRDKPVDGYLVTDESDFDQVSISSKTRTYSKSSMENVSERYTSNDEMNVYSSDIEEVKTTIPKYTVSTINKDLNTSTHDDSTVEDVTNKNLTVIEIESIATIDESHENENKKTKPEYIEPYITDYTSDDNQCKEYSTDETPDMHPHETNSTVSSTNESRTTIVSRDQSDHAKVSKQFIEDEINQTSNKQPTYKKKSPEPVPRSKPLQNTTTPIKEKPSPKLEDHNPSKPVSSRISPTSNPIRSDSTNQTTTVKSSTVKEQAEKFIRKESTSGTPERKPHHVPTNSTQFTPSHKSPDRSKTKPTSSRVSPDKIVIDKNIDNQKLSTHTTTKTTVIKNQSDNLTRKHSTPEFPVHYPKSKQEKQKTEPILKPQERSPITPTFRGSPAHSPIRNDAKKHKTTIHTETIEINSVNVNAPYRTTIKPTFTPLTSTNSPIRKDITDNRKPTQTVTNTSLTKEQFDNVTRRQSTQDTTERHTKTKYVSEKTQPTRQSPDRNPVNQATSRPSPTRSPVRNDLTHRTTLNRTTAKTTSAKEQTEKFIQKETTPETREHRPKPQIVTPVSGRKEPTQKSPERTPVKSRPSRDSPSVSPVRNVTSNKTQTTIKTSSVKVHSPDRTPVGPRKAQPLTTHSPVRNDINRRTVTQTTIRINSLKDKFDNTIRKHSSPEFPVRKPVSKQATPTITPHKPRERSHENENLYTKTTTVKSSLIKERSDKLLKKATPGTNSLVKYPQPTNAYPSSTPDKKPTRKSPTQSPIRNDKHKQATSNHISTTTRSTKEQIQRISQKHSSPEFTTQYPASDNENDSYRGSPDRSPTRSKPCRGSPDNSPTRNNTSFRRTSTQVSKTSKEESEKLVKKHSAPELPVRQLKLRQDTPRMDKREPTQKSRDNFPRTPEEPGDSATPSPTKRTTQTSIKSGLVKERTEKFLRKISTPESPEYPKPKHTTPYTDEHEFAMTSPDRKPIGFIETPKPIWKEKSPEVGERYQPKSKYDTPTSDSEVPTRKTPDRTSNLDRKYYVRETLDQESPMNSTVSLIRNETSTSRTSITSIEDKKNTESLYRKFSTEETTDRFPKSRPIAPSSESEEEPTRKFSNKTTEPTYSRISPERIGLDSRRDSGTSFVKKQSEKFIWNETTSDTPERYPKSKYETTTLDREVRTRKSPERTTEQFKRQLENIDEVQKSPTRTPASTKYSPEYSPVRNDINTKRTSNQSTTKTTSEYSDSLFGKQSISEVTERHTKPKTFVPTSDSEEEPNRKFCQEPTNKTTNSRITPSHNPKKSQTSNQKTTTSNSNWLKQQTEKLIGKESTTTKSKQYTQTATTDKKGKKLSSIISPRHSPSKESLTESTSSITLNAILNKTDESHSSTRTSEDRDRKGFYITEITDEESDGHETTTHGNKVGEKDVSLLSVSDKISRFINLADQTVSTSKNIMDNIVSKTDTTTDTEIHTSYTHKPTPFFLYDGKTNTTEEVKQLSKIIENDKSTKKHRSNTINENEENNYKDKYNYRSQSRKTDLNETKRHGHDDVLDIRSYKLVNETKKNTITSNNDKPNTRVLTQNKSSTSASKENHAYKTSNVVNRETTTSNSKDGNRYEKKIITTTKTNCNCDCENNRDKKSSRKFVECSNCNCDGYKNIRTTTTVITEIDGTKGNRRKSTENTTRRKSSSYMDHTVSSLEHISRRNSNIDMNSGRNSVSANRTRDGSVTEMDENDINQRDMKSSNYRVVSRKSLTAPIRDTLPLRPSNTDSDKPSVRPRTRIDSSNVSSTKTFTSSNVETTHHSEVKDRPRYQQPSSRSIRKQQDEACDTVSDKEARALLNKFSDASISVTTTESIQPVGVKTSDNNTSLPRTNKKVGTTTVTQRKTFNTKVSSADDAKYKIWDTSNLKEFIEESTNFEERQKIREQLRRAMEDKEVETLNVITTDEDATASNGNNADQTNQSSSVTENISTNDDETVTIEEISTNDDDHENDQETEQDDAATTTTVIKKDVKDDDKGNITTTTTRVTTTRTIVNPKPVSPFAKFKEIDKQASAHSASNSPKTPSTPKSPGQPLFKFTDPALGRRAATVKEQLLEWCQIKTKEYENVKLENFSTSWSDGLAFCALIHHFLPDAFDYSKLTPQQRRHNFELAFRIAEEKAGIWPLLDVEDMVIYKKPDWKCVFTYVQSIYRRFRNVE